MHYYVVSLTMAIWLWPLSASLDAIAVADDGRNGGVVVVCFCHGCGVVVVVGSGKTEMCSF